MKIYIIVFFFFQAEDGIRDHCVTGVQTCALPIFSSALGRRVSKSTTGSGGIAHRNAIAEVSIGSFMSASFANADGCRQDTSGAPKSEGPAGGLRSGPVVVSRSAVGTGRYYSGTRRRQRE